MNHKFALISFGSIALVAVLFLALNLTRPAAATLPAASNETANALREAWEFVHASNASIQSPSLRAEMAYLHASNASPASAASAQTPLTLRADWEYVRTSNGNLIPLTGSVPTLRDELEYLHASNAVDK